MSDLPDATPKPAPPRSVWLDPTSPRLFRHAIALLAVSITTAAFGVFFRAAASLVYHTVFHAADIVTAFEKLSPALRVSTVFAGGLLAGIVGVLAARHRSGEGVGGVMEAVALGTGAISLRASLWKALGCWVAVVTGSSVGREGPIIQFGGAIGETAGAIAKMAPERRRLLIAAGTAAGFAAAYNTPFAAVLFVLEIVVGVITLDVVLATVFATAVATAITRLAVGGGPIYGARTFTLVSDLDLVYYLALGAMAGVVGATFSALIAETRRRFMGLPFKQPLKAASGAALVGAIAMVLPDVTGNGYEVINRVLDGGLAAKTILVLLVAKMLATSLSVGSGTPGGAFTPSLFLGAALGGIFGDVLRAASATNAHAPGAYALVGMAAVCAATTHAPLMASVLVFELSGDYSIVLPLLVATAAATVISRRIRHTSIYMDELARRGLGWRMTWSGREMNRGA